VAQQRQVLCVERVLAWAKLAYYLTLREEQSLLRLLNNQLGEYTQICVRELSRIDILTIWSPSNKINKCHVLIF
jgi:hypothetical protein